MFLHTVIMVLLIFHWRLFVMHLFLLSKSSYVMQIMRYVFVINLLDPDNCKYVFTVCIIITYTVESYWGVISCWESRYMINIIAKKSIFDK